MTLTSDLTLDATKFLPDNVPDDVKKLNVVLEKITAGGPNWYDVGIAKYRTMRENGETPLPLPIYLENAKDSQIASREKGRKIPLRVYTPDNGQPSKGIFLHFHGGGFIIGHHTHSDLTLRRYANECQLTAISVGYRLAPEDPHPAAIEDCFDAAEYLVDHAEAEYGAKLLFTGGESAGASLAASTVFHLLRSRPTHRLAGVVLPYGYFDLTHNLPKAASFTTPLVINLDALERFSGAYMPGKSIEEKRHHLVSPLYEDMQKLVSANKSLPPAIFLCGTEDPLLDDTLLMSMKWMITGSEAIVKIYPGAPHGFTAFASVKAAKEGTAAIVQFVQEKLESAT